jgi:hypothetical protein
MVQIILVAPEKPPDQNKPAAETRTGTE